MGEGGGTQGKGGDDGSGGDVYEEVGRGGVEVCLYISMLSFFS